MGRVVKTLRRVDRGLARGEGAVAAVVLLGMILVAAAEALLRNLTNLGLEWANVALSSLQGSSVLLHTGTLWLAFVGASLATHEDKHIGIDVVPRLCPPRVRAVMRGLVGLGAGVVAFYLARAFWPVVLSAAHSRPLEYEVLVADEAMHVCDAPSGSVADAGLDRPEPFCALRSLLDSLGAGVETPGAAAQLLVPVAFLLIAVRLVFKGIGGFVAAVRGDGPGPTGLEKATEEEAAHVG